MRKIIGITGGVGSGKSTVLNSLEKEYGAKILMADKIGHEVFEKNTDTYKKITEHFGKEILDDQERIDHIKLAAIIFKNETEKEYLNKIIHPYVLDRIKDEINKWKNETGINQQENIKNEAKHKTENRKTKNESINKTINLLVIETALMFETGCDKLCDEVWGVITDTEIRIERLMRDRGYSKEKAKSIIDTQLSDEELKERCKEIITNNSLISDTEKSINKLISKLLM